MAVFALGSRFGRQPKRAPTAGAALRARPWCSRTSDGASSLFVAEPQRHSKHRQDCDSPSARVRLGWVGGVRLLGAPLANLLLFASAWHHRSESAARCMAWPCWPRSPCNCWAPPKETTDGCAAGRFRGRGRLAGRENAAGGRRLRRRGFPLRRDERHHVAGCPSAAQAGGGRGGAVAARSAGARSGWGHRRHRVACGAASGLRRRGACRHQSGHAAHRAESGGRRWPCECRLRAGRCRGPALRRRFLRCRAGGVWDTQLHAQGRGAAGNAAGASARGRGGGAGVLASRQSAARVRL